MQRQQFVLVNIFYILVKMIVVLFKNTKKKIKTALGGIICFHTNLWLTVAMYRHQRNGGIPDQLFSFLIQ